MTNGVLGDAENRGNQGESRLLKVKIVDWREWAMPDSRFWIPDACCVMRETGIYELAGSETGVP